MDLFRRLLFSLLDDFLNTVDEEIIHLVSSFIGDKSGQRSHDGWKSNCTHTSKKNQNCFTCKFEICIYITFCIAIWNKNYLKIGWRSTTALFLLNKSNIKFDLFSKIIVFHASWLKCVFKSICPLKLKGHSTNSLIYVPIMIIKVHD